MAFSLNVLSLSFSLGLLHFVDHLSVATSSDSTGVSTVNCSVKCAYDYNAKVPGNFTSVRSFPVRVTGITNPSQGVESVACCELDNVWLKNISDHINNVDKRQNLLIYIKCEGQAFPETRIHFTYDPAIYIKASTALRMVDCGTSWTDVATIGRMVALKLVYFNKPFFRKFPHEQIHGDLKSLFKNVSNIILDGIKPAIRESMWFLESGLFEFPVLHALDIEGPPADYIAWRNMSDAMPNLQYLRLIQANLTDLPKVQFDSEHRKWSALEIGLNANKVAFEKLINPELFSSHKDIADWIRKVDFQFNVDRDSIMKTLDMRGNMIESLQDIPVNSNIEVLNLRQNRLSKLNKQVLQNLTNIYVLDVGQNDLNIFEKDTFGNFNNPGLEMLHIDSTGLGGAENVNWDDLKLLKYLDISNNTVKVIAPMLQKLPGLKMLITRHNNLTVVPFPKEYDTVMYLHAGNNQIAEFPNWVFGSLSLEYLNLQSNHLTTKDVSKVAESQFQQSLTASTKRVVDLRGNCIRLLPVRGHEQAQTLTKILGQFFIDLSDNPLHCGCEDFKDYLINQGVDNIESIGCASSVPTSSQLCRKLYGEEYGQNSSDEYYDIDFELKEPYTCLYEKRRLYTIKVSVTICLLAIIVSLVFYGIFSNRYDIQLAIFYRYGITLCVGNRGDKRNKDAIYDAFVAYSGRDYRWVVFTLHRHLEAAGYKVFIHDRDFMPGREITENIDEGLRKSKMMILVVSEHFLNSEWCTFEFRAAHKEEIVRGTNYMIAIVLQDIPKEKLPQDIRRYLSTKTYLHVNDNWFWRKLAFALPAQSKREAREAPNTAEELAAARRARLQARRQEDGRLLEEQTPAVDDNIPLV